MAQGFPVQIAEKGFPVTITNPEEIQEQELSYKTYSPVNTYVWGIKPKENWTFTHNQSTGLLQVRVITPEGTSGGPYAVVISDVEVSEQYLDWTDLPSRDWFVIGRDSVSGTIFILNPKSSTTATITGITTSGNLSGTNVVGVPVTINSGVTLTSKFKVTYTETSILIYTLIGLDYVLAYTVLKPIGMDQQLAGTSAGSLGTTNNQFDVKINAKSKVTEDEGKTVDLNSIETTSIFSNTDKIQILSPNSPSGLYGVTFTDFKDKLASSSHPWSGKRIVLYGDSLSSTDYTGYKKYLELKTGAIVSLRGYSGWTVAQLTSQTALDSVIALDPDVIIFLTGGNDIGASGTVGSFDTVNPLSEPVVTPPNTVPVSGVIPAYAGTKYIEAASYIGQYLNRKIYDFRPNTNSYVDSTDPYATLRKRKLIFLNGLPQQRTATPAFSDPINHNRKAYAIEEVCKRHHIPMIDTMKLMGLDMSQEPSWVSPTDKINSFGIYTMDGLHLNSNGFSKLAQIESEFLRSISVL